MNNEKNERIYVLSKYLEALAQLRNSGYVCNIEIKSALEQLQNEVSK
ncbi:hypothetical protein ABET36_05680 [Caldifermentibacillus hisashii]|jgi:hypothetical protein